MSVELIKKPITLDEMTTTESVQVVKEKDLIVPDGKPDLQSVVQLDGTVTIDQVDISKDRVMYRGKINVYVIYKTDGNDKEMYTMKGTIPIEDFVIVEGVDKDQNVDFECQIENMSYNVLNERKINAKAIMQITVSATGSQETTIITDVNADSVVEAKEETIEIVSLGNEKEDKTIVKEDLTVPNNKPCIAEILKTALQLQDEQVKRTENEIKYNGMIEVVAMYKAADSDDIEVVTHRVPFEGAVECPQDENEVYWSCDLEVEPSYMQVTPDYDGEDRIIESEFIVTAAYATYVKDNYNTIADIYLPGKKVTTKEKELNYVNLVDKKSVGIPKKETIAIDEDIPEGAEIVSVSIKPTVDDQTLKDGRLTVNGVLDMSVLLLSKTEEANNLDTIVSAVPFTQEIEVENIGDDAVLNVDVQVKDISVYAHTLKEIVLEYLLQLNVEEYEKESLKVVEEVNEEEMTKEEIDAYPSMVVYQVKKGDTLWNLAKK